MKSIVAYGGLEFETTPKERPSWRDGDGADRFGRRFGSHPLRFWAASPINTPGIGLPDFPELALRSRTRWSIPWPLPFARRPTGSRRPRRFGRSFLWRSEWLGREGWESHPTSRFSQLDFLTSGVPQAFQNEDLASVGRVCSKGSAPFGSEAVARAS